MKNLQLFRSIPLPPGYALDISSLTHKPRFIPFLGGKHGFSLEGSICSAPGILPNFLPSLFPEEEQDFSLFPFILGELELTLFGNHIEIAPSLFSEVAAVIDPNRLPLEAVLKESLTFGGDIDFKYLTHPIPLLPIGRFRVGVIFTTGREITCFKFSQTTGEVLTQPYQPAAHQASSLPDPYDIICSPDEVIITTDETFGGEGRIF